MPAIRRQGRRPACGTIRWFRLTLRSRRPDFADKVRSYLELLCWGSPLPRPGYAPRSEGRGSCSCRLTSWFQPAPYGPLSLQGEG